MQICFRESQGCFYLLLIEKGRFWPKNNEIYLINKTKPFGIRNNFVVKPWSKMYLANFFSNSLAFKLHVFTNVDIDIVSIYKKHHVDRWVKAIPVWQGCYKNVFTFRPYSIWERKVFKSNGFCYKICQAPNLNSILRVLPIEFNSHKFINLTSCDMCL